MSVDHDFSGITVSVIVPLYNVEEFVEQCVTSIRRQTFPRLDILLINDGSTDGTGELADRLAKDDPRITVVHQVNAGVSHARNTGLARAVGEYVCFVDGDDWLRPSFVETFVLAAMQHDADLVLGTRTVPLDEKPLAHSAPIQHWEADRATAELIYPSITIGCWNKLFRKTLLDEHALRFETDLHMGEGLRFITSACQRSNRVIAISDPLYFYRRDNLNSATSHITVSKMDNAMRSVERIESDKIHSSKQVQSAVTYHKAMIAFTALRILVDDRTRSDESVSRSLRDIRKLPARVIVHAPISMKQKTKAMLIRFAPSMLARLGGSPNEHG